VLVPSFPNEPARLAALQRYAILDTTPEEALDDVARLAATIFNVPIALISLVDASRQWFKSRIGIDATEAPRDHSFCDYAIRERDVFVVEDAQRDPRFVAHPLVVGDPHIRFYAGSQLATPDGHNLGMLCVIDTKPRVLSPEAATALPALARQVVVQLELRRKIAELERAEAALRRSESRTRSIIDHALGGLITANAQGVIDAANPAAARMFGATAEELSGCRLESLLEGGFALEPALGRVTEWRARRSDGGVFPCELSLFEFCAGDGERHFAAHMLDISERHEVDQLKKDFISTVSHELRTPLTSIRGSLGLLAAEVMGELSAEARQLVTVAERNSVRLITLINDILDFEKLENGKGEMDLRPTSLLGVLERSIESVSAFALQENVGIELHGGIASVLADETRLMQVVVHLLSNAVKYSDRGGVVILRAGVEGSFVRVQIQDRGSGIAESAQSRLFQRFHQIDGGDARRKPGTGLGLAICKTIVEQHGGTIGVVSRAGEGSTFWFLVPIASNDAPALPRDEWREGVLDVDDMDTLLDVMRTKSRPGDRDLNFYHGVAGQPADQARAGRMARS
jgi:PAS domain S-box-containing protein